MTKPAIFETAFTAANTQIIKDRKVTVTGITIGNVRISSGRIIACDPMHIDEYGIPFTQTFPTGEFPVQLAIANVEGEETNAFVRIKFSDEPVVRWEFALQKDQSPIPFGGLKSYGYGVDGGTGIFIDEAAAKIVNQDDLRNFEAPMFKEMMKHYHGGWKFTMYNFGQHNLAAFSTGLGDGRYSTYIGFDAKGQPCRLLTDFAFFEWSAN
jgi:hypothetical protein